MAMVYLSLRTNRISAVDHVGGQRCSTLYLKHPGGTTNRRDQRLFISFQPYSYGCMPLNPHLTWTLAVDGGIYDSIVAARFVLLSTLFRRFIVVHYTLHSFQYRRASLYRLPA